MPKYDEFGVLVDLLPEVSGSEPVDVATPRGTLSATKGTFGAPRPSFFDEMRQLEEIGLKRAGELGETGQSDYMARLVQRDQARRQQEQIEGTRAVEMFLKQAQAQKALGEATEAMSKAQAGPGTGRAPTFWDIAQGLAVERHQKAGKPGMPSFEDINTAAGEVRFEGAKGTALGTGAVPTMITPKQITETQERAVRINQTKQVLDPQIWDTAMRSWGAPGRVSGTLGSVLEVGGYLSPELQILYNVIDKMGIKERHDFFGANFTPGEAAIARTIIPNRNMHPAKLKSVLELNRMIDEWAEAFEVEMSQAPRNSAEWLTKAQIFRKHYPFPVTAEQATVYSPSAQEKQGMMSPPATRKIGETWTFPDGQIGRWDGKAWEVTK